MSDEKCSICRVVMDGSMQEYALNCNHRFHTECIIDTLRRNPECPVCRDKGGIQTAPDTEYDLFFSSSDGVPQHSNDPAHVNVCLQCGKNNPQSEVYHMYRLVKQLGKELLRERYPLLPQLNKDLTEIENDLRDDFDSKYSYILKQFKLEIQYLYHATGNSENYKKYIDIKQKTKAINQNFKRDLSEMLKDLGYELDFDTKAVSAEFYKQIMKKKKKDDWSFVNMLYLCRKYSLKKYAPPAESQ